MGALTKAQITAALAGRLEISKVETSRFLDTFASLACDEAKANGSFTLPGLGKLVLVDRKARQGRNPQTGETIQIPAKKVVKFRVSKSCKDAVLVAPVAPSDGGSSGGSSTTW